MSENEQINSFQAQSETKPLAKTTWVGMLCRPFRVGKLEEFIHNWMHRAMVIEHELVKHNHRLFCYSPLDVNPKDKTAMGYIFEEGQFRKIRMSVPRVNYDWYIGFEEKADRAGFEYINFFPWAKQNGYEIYPGESIRDLARDKLQTGELLSQLDQSLIPFTEIFADNIPQLETFIQKYQGAFIKPRYGSMGNGIFVIKQLKTHYAVDYYSKGEKISKTAPSLREAHAFIQKYLRHDNYLIQEAIQCLRVDDSVFDIRVIMIHDGLNWHYLSQVRLGAKGKEISNLSQGGRQYTTEEIVDKVFAKERAPVILKKLQHTATEMAEYLRNNCDPALTEIALDLMIDENEKFTLAELNTKPGLEGGPEDFIDFFNMTPSEKNLYENLSLKHGQYLAQALIYRAAQKPSTPTNATQWLGMVCNIRKTPIWNSGQISPWMFRQFVLDKLLAKYDYKLFTYSPAEIDPHRQEANGFVFENGEFQRRKMPIPKVNYDFHFGSVKASETPGINYAEFEPWAIENGYQVYPTRPLRALAGDKLRSAEIIAEYDNSIVPYTEAYTGEESQIEKFMRKEPQVFIKPRFGNKGNNIYVIKLVDKQYCIEFYLDEKKHTISFNTLAECVPVIGQRAKYDEYIIQQAIDVMSYQGSVFDIRTIVFKEGKEWHFLTELVLGKKGNAVSNLYQGGKNYHTEDFLHNLFPKQQVAVILEKIKQISINIAKKVDKEYDSKVNELAFDLLLDTSHQFYVSEINVKPGLAGEPMEYKNFAAMSEEARHLYETVTLKHGELLIKSLLSRDAIS